jgi:hypothetical protein
MEVEAACPYCGEPIAIWVDAGGGSRQRYVEDCSVCCRPIEIHLSPGDGEDDLPQLDVRRDDD